MSLLRFCRRSAARDAVHCRLVFSERVLSNFFREASFDRSIIRVKSAHKWPEPMTIDTSLPTIIPPLPVLARTIAINQPREAFAELTPPSPKASEYPGTIRAKRKVAARVRPKRIADYRATPETLPSGWLPRL